MPTLSSRLLRWIDGEPRQDPRRTAQLRVQHLVASLQVSLGVPYAYLFHTQGIRWALPVLVPILVASPLSLLLVSRRGRPALGGELVSLCAFSSVVAAIVARGGITTSAAAWMLIMPLLGTFMVSRRHGTLITAATTLALVLLWLAGATGVAMPVGLPQEMLYWMPLLDYTILALGFGGILFVQADLWERTDRRARESAQARYTFLATMSHEIRTPLNGVLGLTQALLGTDLTQDQRHLANTIGRSGRLLRSLLDDVLDFSKIDTGAMEVSEQPMELQAMLQDLMSLWQGAASERGLELRVELAPKTPDWILADPNKLKQILGNLLSNAIKFTPEGSILVRASVHQGSLHLSVQDQGIGLSEQAQIRIFRAFQQAYSSTTRQYGGTGLGLAICRRLAHFLGGELRVQSTLGQGSTFTLAIPMVPVTAPIRPQPQLRSSASLEGLKVLVAEDNAVNRLVILRLLEQLGVQVTMAHDGDECVELWRRQAPDLILMDCQMPACDGYQATRQIRAQGGQLPIIALTANSMAGDRARCLSAGMNEHLGKPVDSLALERTLRAHRPQKKRSA